ncbi:Uma2 family endonuclease [Granulicella aggregans]|uniref:Uma2 family endonuclease n=2 Tax=Granulicella aggregans TaxID=474949 RepID=A0A7W7ZAJ4_9BACT|nr:Uma2 family endonuclease [Granulicella aggregans]
MNLDLAEVALPMRLRLEQPMTDEEFLRFCAANNFLRVEREVNGEILVMTPANSRTSRINIQISRFLAEWAEEDGRGVAFDSSGGFTLPDGSMRSPDTAWILRSRWNALSDTQQSSFAPICPDFVIELRSPSDKLLAVRAKMEMWIANGAQVAWLIDPERTEISVYRPEEESPDFFFDPSSIQGTGVIAGFELIMARIWK